MCHFQAFFDKYGLYAAVPTLCTLAENLITRLVCPNHARASRMLLNAASALEDKQFSSYAHRKATMGKVLTPLGKVLASSLMSHTKSGAS